MKITATLKNLRMSPRKVRLVTDSIAGMDANVALVQLESVTKKASIAVKKLIESALANAQNNFGLDKDNMFVKSIAVGEGSRLKRWLPRAHGRATLILKRTCHIKLELEERVEGKNRKSKQQLEKEKKQRLEAKEKALKELEKEMQEAEKEEGKENAGVMPEKKKMSGLSDDAKNKGQDGFLKKVFQRKSV